MSEVPPGGSNYPRPELEKRYGSAERLQALGAGYFGLSWPVLITAGLAFAALGERASHEYSALRWIAILLFSATFLASYLPNRKIAFGMGWPPATAVAMSAGLALFSWLCLGMIGYAVIVAIVVGEFSRYGISGSGLGIRRDIFRAALNKRRALEAAGSERSLVE